MFKLIAALVTSACISAPPVLEPTTSPSATNLAPVLSEPATTEPSRAAHASTAPASAESTSTGSTSTEPSGAEPASPDPTSAKMLAALETVSADEIKTDVYFIASDDLAGRDTPSEGLKVAARFLRSRLERLGWKPGAKEGYFHEYPVFQRAMNVDASRIVWEGKGAQAELKYGTDYFLSSNFDVMDVDATGPVVFGGDGSKSDLGSSRVEGKWALVFDEGTEPRDLSRYARKAKAKGLIVAPGPNYKGEDYASRWAAALDRQRRGTVAPARPVDAKDAKNDDEDGGSGGFPMVLVTRPVAEAMLAAAKKPAVPAKGADLGIQLTETRRVVGNVPVENVCGFWPGSDPVLSKECIILSAHYDHIGVQKGEIHNGADDNGSGTSLMLAVAEALVEYGPMKRSVMIIWVSGEEKGLWGSRAFAENPWFPDGVKPVANINIDMVGRNAPDKLLITPTKARAKDYNDLVKVSEKLAPLEGFPKLGSADAYYTRSDHAEFAKLGIPVMFLFSDVHDDYHGPGDDADKLDYDKIHRVGRLVLRILDGLDDKRELK